MLNRIFIAVTFVVASPAMVSAQDVFFSFGQGANVSQVGTADVTDGTGSAYVYVKEDFDIRALDIDLTNDDTSVIQFTGALLYNGNFAGSTRFSTPSEAIASGDTGRFFAAAVNTLGIRSNLKDFDPNFDVDADAFLLGKVDYNIVGEGTVNLTLAAGDRGLVDILSDGTTIALSPEFGNGTLTVSSIPEPSSATFLALGALGWLTRRRRA